MPCAVVPGLESYASALIAFVDCQTAELGTKGYAALTAGSGIVPSLLGVFVTLYIAFWGYRLLTGERPSLAEFLPSFARLAIVMTLAASWPAYRTLVYDVVLQSPAEIAGAIDLSETGRDDGLALGARLDDVDVRFQRLAIFGTGSPRTPEELDYVRTHVAPPLFLNFDTFAIGAARLGYLASALGAFALARLLAGALLALGPLIGLFLLFDSTRGLFLGWVRVLTGLTVAGILVTLVVDIEVLLLAPWLSQLLSLRAADIAIPGVPAQLLATVLIFSGVILAACLVPLRLVATYWPRSRVALPPVDRAADVTMASRIGAGQTPLAVHNEPNRARAIAEAIQVADHRRTRLATVMAGAIPGSLSTGSAIAAGPNSAFKNVGADGARRTRMRSSASATSRDHR